MKTPDITRTQLVAMIAAFLNLLTAFSVPLTDIQVEAIKQFLDTMIIIVGADAIIRFGRNISKRDNK